MTQTQDEKPILLTMREGSGRYNIPLPTLYEMAHRTPGFVRTTARAIRIHRVIFEGWLESQAHGNHANG